MLRQAAAKALVDEKNSQREHAQEVIERTEKEVRGFYVDDFKEQPITVRITGGGKQATASDGEIVLHGNMCAEHETYVGFETGRIAYYHPDGWYLVKTCPYCMAPVASHVIKSLTELGELLEDYQNPLRWEEHACEGKVKAAMAAAS